MSNNSASTSARCWVIITMNIYDAVYVIQLAKKLFICVDHEKFL